MMNYTRTELEKAFAHLDNFNRKVFKNYRALAKEASHYGDHLITYQPMQYGRIENEK